MNSSGQQPADDAVQVPASNGWPLVAAFGLTLVFAGLLTHVMVSILGAVSMCAGLIGWFREVLPQETHESVAVEKEGLVPSPPRPTVRHLEVGEFDHRARLPLEIYPYSAGVRGGLVGGAAMAALAILYGIIGHKSIWYPHQSSRRGRFGKHLGDELRPTSRVQYDRAGARNPYSCRHVRSGWLAVRRRLTHVPASPGVAGRNSCTIVLVRNVVRRDWGLSIRHCKRGLIGDGSWLHSLRSVLSRASSWPDMNELPRCNICRSPCVPA